MRLAGWRPVSILTLSLAALLAWLVREPRAADPPAIPGLICTLTGHSDAVYSIAFTPDGQHVITGSFDRSLRLWDAKTGVEQRMYGGDAGHQNLVLSVAVCPDGRRMASGGSDSVVKVWDLPTAAAPRVFTHPAPVNGLALSGDGQRLATAGRDGRVRLWDAVDGQSLGEFSGFAGPVTGVALAADGRMVIGVGSDGSVRFWNAADRALVAESIAHAGPIATVAAHPTKLTGVVVCTAGVDGALRFWQLPTPPRTLPPQSEAIQSLAVASDARTVFAAAGRVVHVVSLADGRTVRTLSGPAAAIRCLAVSAGGTTLVAGTADGQLWVWDPTTGNVRLQAQAHDGATHAVALHAGTAQILTAGADGSLQLWSPPVPGRPTEATAKTVVPAHPDGVNAAAFGATPAQIVTAGADGAVKLWDSATQKDLRTYGKFPESGVALAVDRTASRMAAGAGSEVRVWQFGTGQLERTLRQPSAVTSLAFDAAGSALICGTTDGSTHIWDLKSGLELQAFPGQGSVRTVLALPTTSLILRAGDDKQITILRPFVVRALVASSKPLRALALSPDRGTLFCAGDDGVVRGFNATTGAPGLTFTGMNEPVKVLAIAADGRRVAAAGDRVVKFFTPADGKLAGSFSVPAGVRALAFHPTADLLATGGDDRAVTVRQIGTPLGKSVQSLVLDGAVTAIAYSPDAGTIFAAGSDHTVRAWRPSSEVPTTLPHANLVDAVAFQTNGSRLATGGHDGILRIWDSAGRLARSIHAHAPPEVIHALAWHPDGKSVVTAGSDRSARLWDAESGELIWEFKAFDMKSNPNGHRAAIYWAALSPDGLTLATGGADRSVKLWNVANGAFIRHLTFANAETALPGAVHGVRFSPDGQRIVAAGSAPKGGGYAGIWRVTDGQKVYGELLSTGPIFGLAVSPDGRRLAIACGPRGRSGPAVGYVIAMPAMK